MANFLSRMIPIAAACGFTALSAAVAPAQPVDEDAVAYQVDTAHTGYAVFGKTTFAPPFKILWSRKFGNSASYPIIIGGSVYVTIADSASSGNKLYSLNEKTGETLAGPIAINSTYSYANLAFDKDRLFVLNFDGLLTAFGARTLQQLWSNKLPDHYAFTAPPTASGGTVYVGGAGDGGTLYAVNEKSGSVLWTKGVANGDDSSPTIADGGLFVSYPCQVYDFNPLTGASLWHYSRPCEGGGGATAVYANRRLYVRDWASTPPGFVFNATNGKIVGRFAALDFPPAIVGDIGYFVNGSNLEADALPSMKARWTFAGDGGLNTAPIVVNNALFVGSSSGNLYALDPASGKVLQTISLDSSGVGAMNAGQGMLIVSTGKTLYAIRSK